MNDPTIGVVAEEAPLAVPLSHLTLLARLTHERLAVIESALKAVIATHQDMAEVRRVFDASYSQHQISRRQPDPAIDGAVLKLITTLFNGEE